MARRPGSSNTLRLIGGLHGGRKLQFPDSRGLRPTADRVRETLFNWLQPDIESSHCLDLFAGSGALGFEAASRGAGSVTMVEAAAAVSKKLNENVQLLGLEQQVQVIHSKAERFLHQADNAITYDIVFIDPPFADQYLPAILFELAQTQLLKPGCKVYVERDAAEKLLSLPDKWHILRDKTAGQVAYSLLKTTD